MRFEKNQLAEVRIEDIGSEGEGIGKVDGFPLFVKDTVVGDLVRVKLTKVKKNYAFARLEEILEESADRITPPCPKYRACGGCQIQQLSYGKQLEFKQKKVWNDLLRIGGFTERELSEVFLPILGMEEPWRYRNKAQYPVGRDKEGSVITGFYAGRTHSIIANTDCLLGAKENEAVLMAVLNYVKESGCSIYNEETGKGLLRHVLIRKSRATGEVMVCLILNGRKLPGQELLIREFQKIPEIVSISINVNTEQTNVILGKETVCISGKPQIEDTLWLWDEEGQRTGEHVTYRISPNSFYQVNPVQTERLYSLALQYAGLTGTEIVWDLYCGIGTISLFLAGHAGKV
ncbi:MAG: 23S rRNA (uracil(1939)-C(5))-methyltransferase RlmD, partial [Lachnospiraceae bacterium]|nr:23S rRNA (uracil(1939)-C(5))-methyltransferase RlmD [Lachnospiraceae bacterium]